MAARKTLPAKDHPKASRISVLAKKAGRLARENRKKGYH